MLCIDRNDIMNSWEPQIVKVVEIFAENARHKHWILPTSIISRRNSSKNFATWLVQAIRLTVSCIVKNDCWLVKYFALFSWANCLASLPKDLLEFAWKVSGDLPYLILNLIDRNRLHALICFRLDLCDLNHHFLAQDLHPHLHFPNHLHLHLLSLPLPRQSLRLNANIC